jgi:hypothetical protein
MKLDLGTRLGFAGVVLALFSIGAFYIWPDKKWIGGICLFLAAALALAWVVTELRHKSRGVPVPTPSFVFLFGVPLATTLRPFG